MLLIFILVFFIFLLFFLLKVTLRNSKKLSLDTLKDSPELFLRFLDSFYVTNIYYTIFCSFCYFFYTIFIILIIRYIFLGYKKDINGLNMEYLSFTFFIIIILGLLLLVLIKTLIEVLFYKEVLKLYLYLCQNLSLMTLIINSILKYSLYNFLGPINLFLYCVSTLKLIPTDDDDDYQEFYYYKYIYEKEFVKNITKICVKYALKFIGILWIFKFLHYICNLMYEYLRWYKFLYFVFLIIFFIIIFYDFINFRLYYTYYYFFFFCIINIMFKYLKFIDSKTLDLDEILSKYFYKNTLDYKLQRTFIKNTAYYYHDIKYKSEENKALIYKIKDTLLGTVIEYTFNDLQKLEIFDKILIENKKKVNYIYLTYFINILFIIIAIYFIFNGTKYVIILNILNIQIPVIILSLPTLIIIYITTKIYVLPKDAQEDFIGYYIYNKIYARIFVLLVILQSIILGIFFYYTNILEFFSDNALWNNLGFSIYRNYNIYEKQQYFIFIFESKILKDYSTFLSYTVEELKYFITFKNTIIDLITETTTIKDIQEVFYEMLKRGNLVDIPLYEECFYEYNFTIKSPYNIDATPIMYCIKNMINILVFWEFFICYLDAYMQIKNPFSKDILIIIYKWIKFLKGY